MVQGGLNEYKKIEATGINAGLVSPFAFSLAG
jgi:hypothetical protein